MADFDVLSVAEIFEKVYKLALGREQAIYLANVVKQYADVEEIPTGKRFGTIDEAKRMIDLLVKIPLYPRISRQNKVSYIQFYKNKSVTFEPSEQTINITLPATTEDTSFRINTGYIFSPIGSAMLVYTESGIGKPIIVDTTSDSALFLEVRVPANDQPTIVPFKFMLFVTCSPSDSQTNYKQTTNYFAKSGSLANYKSSGNVKFELETEENLIDDKVQKNMTIYLDEVKETKKNFSFKNETEQFNLFVLPRKRTIGTIIPMCGIVGSNIINPTWDYETATASFMYPRLRLKVTFEEKLNINSVARNSGFNGCFYEIENYSIIVRAFKNLSKIYKHINAIKNRINVKANLSKDEKVAFITEIALRSKNPTDFNEILNALPATIEELPPINNDKTNLFERLEQEHSILNKNPPIRKTITAIMRPTKRTISDLEKENGTTAEATEDVPVEKKIKLAENYRYLIV